MRVTASSPDMTPQNVGKVILPDELQRGVKRNPLYQSASDEAREIPKRQLKRRISISEGELREQISFRSIRKPVAVRAKFTKNRAATNSEHLEGVKLQLRQMSQQIAGPSSQLNAASRQHAHSLSSLVDPCRVQFALSQTPPMTAATSTFAPMLNNGEHRGELDMSEKYNYDLARAQLKASSRTSALLAGFAMVALVELQYDEDTPRPVLILLGVVTSLLVSVHLLALMMSTCILPYMEATGCTQDSPHIRLKFYIDLSWIFSTCIGLLLFLFEIGIIFIVKFFAVHFQVAAYVTTAMLVPVVIVFIVFSYLIHKNRVSHSFERITAKINSLHNELAVEAGLATNKPPTVQDI